MEQKDFVFSYNKALEYQMFLLVLSSNDLIKFLETNNLEYDKEVIKLIEEERKKLTQYSSWELNYFYNMEEFNMYSLGTMFYMYNILTHPVINNVSDLISKIESMTLEETLRVIFMTHFYFLNNVPKEKVIHKDQEINKEELIEIIKKANLKNNTIKQKIIESLESPIETRQRYCLLLKQIYERIYLNIENDIEIKVNQKIPFYENLYHKDHHQFTKDLLKTEYDVFSGQVKIHISYFWNIDFWYLPKRQGDELIILGINSDKIYIQINPKDLIYNFLKTISDKTRLEIIELLSERDWYVNELAEKLNVSTATTSYHLSRLQDLNIVDFRRVDQKFYYYILKDQLKKYFNEATKILIKE